MLLSMALLLCPKFPHHQTYLPTCVYCVVEKDDVEKANGNWERNSRMGRRCWAVGWDGWPGWAGAPTTDHRNPQKVGLAVFFFFF
jgi:hypothetical protein